MLILLFLTGIAAGFINVLAGGGSILTMAVLITVGGMPSVTANMTNRIGVVAQNIAGTWRFHHHRRLSLAGKWHLLPSMALGGWLGAVVAARIHTRVFDYVLAVTLPVVCYLILCPKPAVRHSYRLPLSLQCLLYLGIGFYGGFMQLGIGLVMLAVLNLIENLDLVQANALKVVMVLVSAIVSTVVFVFSGKIVWNAALVLALGNTIGGMLGVESAVRKGEKFIRVVLIVAVIISMAKLLGILDWVLTRS